MCLGHIDLQMTTYFEKITEFTKWVKSYKPLEKQSYTFSQQVQLLDV